MGYPMMKEMINMLYPVVPRNGWCFNFSKSSCDRFPWFTARVQGICHWKNQWGRRSLMSWSSGCSGHRWYLEDQRHFGETTSWPIKMEIWLRPSKSNHRKCKVVVCRTKLSNGLAGSCDVCFTRMGCRWKLAQTIVQWHFAALIS
jgi:hypothetical protein